MDFHKNIKPIFVGDSIYSGAYYIGIAVLEAVFDTDFK